MIQGEEMLPSVLSVGWTSEPPQSYLQLRKVRELASVSAAGAAVWPRLV